MADFFAMQCCMDKKCEPSEKRTSKELWDLGAVQDAKGSLNQA